MDFEHLLDQAIDMLRRHRRLTYRTLKRQFKLDDQVLEELKDELLFSQPVVDEHDRGLFWTGETAAPDADTRHREIAENRFQTLLLAVMTVESELLYLYFQACTDSGSGIPFVIEAYTTMYP
ncbi:hypothetical protein C2W62_39915 [Candidatus Entotheonella serta]|nr:hypothetical protein C2W62_39915 [Candidatus Entotheonella serta]